MKISEAIENLEKIRDGEAWMGEEEWEASCGLGIEALKWRKQMEKDYGSWCGPLLPGETD